MIRNGQRINSSSMINSTTTLIPRQTRAISITILFILTPMTRANPTNPSRYSFFHGLTNVRRNNGTENIWSNPVFHTPKEWIMPMGPSMIQKRKKSRTIYSVLSEPGNDDVCMYSVYTMPIGCSRRNLKTSFFSLWGRRTLREAFFVLH